MGKRVHLVALVWNEIVTSVSSEGILVDLLKVVFWVFCFSPPPLPTPPESRSSGNSKYNYMINNAPHTLNLGQGPSAVVRGFSAQVPWLRGKEGRIHWDVRSLLSKAEVGRAGGRGVFLSLTRAT